MFPENGLYDIFCVIELYHCIFIAQVLTHNHGNSVTTCHVNNIHNYSNKETNKMYVLKHSKPGSIYLNLPHS